MIALLLALALPGATLDTVVSPFHLSAFTGLNADAFGANRTWLEMDAQAEFGTIAFLRGTYSQPLTGPGARSADLTQRMHTLCLGTEWRHDWWWLATGAGWTWRRLDTNATYLDPRKVFVEDQSGLRSENATQVQWIWPNRLASDGPYFMGEIGVGSQHAAVCLRSEYRFCPALGIFGRFRIP